MPERRLNPDLTLSAVPDPDREHARVSAYVDRELRRVAQLRKRYLTGAAERRLDALFDYVLGRS